MSTTGPPDRQPGEESEGIHYFDFSESFETSEFKTTETDPFESEDPATREASKEKETPRLALVRRREKEHTSEAASTRDAFEFALEDLPLHSLSDADAGDLEAGFAPLTAYVGREGGDAPQRAQFISAFDAAQMRLQQSFVAIALRMPDNDPASSWFPLVEQGIRSALHSEDTVLVDRERFRLVAVLPGRNHDDVRPILGTLMGYLREHTDNAAEVGHRISVFTAPQGRPFSDGASFLAEVYDKP